MASGITEFDSMMYSKQGGVPWHTLGNPVEQENCDAVTALRESGMDWDVDLIPLTWSAPALGADGMPRFLTMSSGQYAVVRRDLLNRAMQEQDPEQAQALRAAAQLGTVGKKYTIVQNRDLFRFFDPIVEQGEAIYETCGTLHRGAKVWILARCPQDLTVEHGDKIDVSRYYILLVGGHDGDTPITAQFVEVRVVCQNTLSAALKGARNRYSIRHTAGAGERVAELSTLMGLSTNYRKQMEAAQQFLAGIPVKREDLNDYFKKVLSGTEEEEEGEARKEGNKRAQNRRDEALRIFDEEASVFAPSALSMVNAVTGLVDHVPPSARSAEANIRLDSMWFGKGAEQKARALNLALGMYDYSPVSVN